MIRNGENSQVEFKRDDIDNRRLAKELVSFSNLAGGVVLLGVEDDREIAGLEKENAEEWVMTAARDKIRPALMPVFEVIRDVEDGKDVAVIRVPQSASVHGVWHDQRHIYYIRVGTLTREPSPEELARLFQQRGAVRAELRPIPNASLDDLDLRRLRDYFGRVREQDVPDTSQDWRDLLFNTEIMVEAGVTVAGLLLFGAAPNRFLPQAGIDAAAFPGTDKDYEIIERLTLRGPMTPLYDSDEAQIEPGLTEQALAFINRNARAEAKIDDTGRRVERRRYPLEALREAIVNALIHRDYLFGGTDVELSLYSDRLEIVSPGQLPNGITPERMRRGIRANRNQLLKDVMRDYGYLEHLGMGVPRKIIRGMRAHNGSDPDLVEEDERFTVRLWA